MESTSRFCTNCGSELDQGAKFCAQCGARTRQGDTPAARGIDRQSPQEEAPAAAREVGRQLPEEEPPVAADAVGSPPSRGETSASADVDWSKYSRFLRVDTSGGFASIVTPIMIWTVAAGSFIWAILGLVSLRFNLSILNLEDLFLTMLIIVGIMLSVIANAYLALCCRDRAGALWTALSFLPMLWAAFLCVGLSIMIWQVWTDFAGGPNELRRAMFSLIGVGVCGVYGGYLSLVAIGTGRIYHVVRRVVYVLIAITAVEILDALWWGTGYLTGEEMWEHFLRAGGTAVTCFVVYAIIAFFMAQARGKKTQTSMLLVYFALGLIGFTIAVGALWDTFPPGAIRFVHGAIVIVTIATVGLLLVQRYQRMRDTDGPPTGSAVASGQSAATPAA